MAAAQILTAIAIIALSMALGLIAFYLISDLPNSQKKKWMSDMVSQLINFVIFIWVGKILLNISIFITDPLAILAYPSNADAFYLAVLFSALTLAYKQLRGQMDVISLIDKFIPVFLIASFVYEFIQFVWFHHSNAIGYLGLLAVLIIGFLLSRDRSQHTVTPWIIIGWSIGTLILSYALPFITVFGYIMAPWFVGLIFITGILLLITNLRKKVT